MNQKINNLLVDRNFSIKETMRVIDRNGLGVAFVMDEDKKLWGVVTDGDIRKAILRGANIEKPIEEIVNKKPIVIEDRFFKNGVLDFSVKQEIKRRLPIITGSLKVPVVNHNGEIKDVIFVAANEENSYLVLKGKPKFSKEGVRKVLVIGGAGYFGSFLCSKLLKKGYQVRVLDNLSYGGEGIRDLHQDKNFEFQKGDIRNISDIIEATKNIDAVIHLAGVVGDPACAMSPRETLETNYLATKTITEVCKYFQINRFIFTSTCSVYGKNPFAGQKLTEKSPLNPISLYAETKIKCERAILEAMDENFSPTIFRMATLYGYSPNMRFDLAVNLMTAQALFDKKITIFGGEQWRPWLHLEDAADAHIVCLEKPIDKIRGEIFNVVSENYKVIKIGKIINSLCPEAKLEITKEINDKRDYNVSFDKISQLLNYQPKKKIADGVVEIKDLVKKGLIKNYKDLEYRTLYES